MEEMKLGGLIELSSQRVGSLVIRIIGPFLLVVLFFLLGFMTYIYFTEILVYILPEIGVFFSMFLTCVGLTILFNVFYNYVLCVCTGPGHPSEMLELPSCKQCKGPKPLRTHHCSVCNKCVLKMDHHCPWIMNCVGHKNHRYFLLFLLYLTIGAIFMTCVSFPRFKYGPNNKNVSLCFILSMVFSVVLLGFTAWHFFLVCVGSTTIELFAYYSETENRNRFNFSRGTWKKNLETVFGTTNLFYAILPNSQELPFDGIDWPDTLHSI